MRRDTMAQHDLNHFKGHQGSQSFPVSSRKRPLTCCVLCVFSQTEQNLHWKITPKIQDTLLCYLFPNTHSHDISRNTEQALAQSSRKLFQTFSTLKKQKCKAAVLNRLFSAICMNLYYQTTFDMAGPRKQGFRVQTKHVDSLSQLARWKLTVGRL